MSSQDLAKAAAVSPESTIESANTWNHILKKRDREKSDGKDGKKLVCESTVESAPRRNFVKRAAVATAAVAIGGTALLRNNLIPESSASSATCTVTTPGSNTSGRLAVWNGKAEITDTGPASLCGSSCLAILCVLNLGHGTGVCACSVFGIGVRGGSPGATGVLGTSCAGTGVCGSSILGAGVYGSSVCSAGVQGRSLYCTSCKVGGSSPGVCGQSVSGPGVKGTSTSGTGVTGTTCSGAYGVMGQSKSSTGWGVFGTASAKTGETYGVIGTVCSLCGVGVIGCALTGTGVRGVSICGIGVYGSSKSHIGVIGTSASSIGVVGESCSGYGVLAGSCGVDAIPIAAIGAKGQKANLMQFEKYGGCLLSVVNKCGWLGLGATSAPTTLHVGGSVSARIATPTSAYSMGNTDFAVLANATSAPFTVTLPAASTAAGMIVFIKKIDTSTNAVTVAAHGTDKIEGKASESLSKKYESLTLISDGSANWYVLSNAT